MGNADRAAAAAPAVMDAPKVGWQGGQKAETAARYRWQKDWTRQTTRTLHARERWRNVRIGVLLAITVLLFAMLLYYLLFAPAQTPLVAVAATGYRWPLPPNAWAKEDVEGLRELDGQTLRVRDCSAAWETQQRGLRQLDQQIQAMRDYAKRAGAIVIYVSMFGTVDAAGEPCLLPPDASPHQSGSWIPLRTLIERIRQQKLPDDLPKLLVLDCNRELVNWHIGLPYNCFAEQLPRVVAEAKLPNLVVLSSTRPGQQAVASPLLQGSVFGQYFRLGIAGAADRRAEGGNGNGRISLRELQRYVSKHTNDWVAHFQAGNQQAMLVPADVPDVEICWSLRRSSVNAMIAQAQQIQRAAPSIAQSKLEQLWQQRDRLQAITPYRFDPVAWRDIEHRLLALEQLAQAGQAYKAQATDLLEQLDRDLQTMQQRMADITNSATVSLPQLVAAANPAAPPADAAAATAQQPGHSLAMVQLLGTLPSATLQSIRAQYEVAMQAPSLGNVGQALETIQSLNVQTPLTGVMLLKFLERYRIPQLWSQAETITHVLRLHDDVEAHAAAGANAAVADERVFAWQRMRIEEADAARREALDLLLAGEVAAGKDPTAAVAAIYDAVGAARRALDDDTFDQPQNAAALRDRLWSELPYLALWLARPQDDPAQRTIADGTIQRVLLPLLDDAHRLNDLFVRQDFDPAQPAELMWQGAGLTANVQRRFTALHDMWEAAITRVLEAKTHDATALREIDALLDVPLASADQRRELWRKRATIAAELENLFLAAANSRTQAKSRDARTDELSDTVDGAGQIDTELVRMEVRWPDHPALAILAEAPGASTPQLLAAEGEETEAERIHRMCRNMARRGAAMRVRLKAIGNDDELFLRKRSGEAAEQMTRARREASLALATACRAESAVRTASCFWFSPPADDPVELRRRMDLQQLLVWQAHRVLDDFWGSAGEGEPFFARAADGYLRAAKNMLAANAEMQRSIDQLEQLLMQRRQAAQQGLAVTISDLLMVDEVAQVTTKLTLRGGPPEARAGMPTGRAVIYLADEQGRLAELTQSIQLESFLKTDPAMIDWERSLPGQTLRGRGPEMHAGALLRGNEYRAPVLLRAAGGTSYAYELPVYGPPQVTLQAAARRQASVIFILDCSHSMIELIDVEAPGSGEVTQSTRMEIAKNALRSLLQQLAREGDCRVGVRFFGHRVGWSTVQAGTLLMQTRYGRTFPPILQPYADVENVLPLGRFDSVEEGKISDLLATVQPWGESPLYLAITDALRELGSDSVDNEKSIVVITDGANNQFNPAPEFNRTRDDVLRAAAGKNVRIHIIGFGIQTDEAERAENDFMTITQTTSGQYFSAINAASLIQSLHSLLQPRQYAVRDERGRTLASAEVGTSVTVPESLADNQTLRVDFEALQTRLKLSAGDAARLGLSPDGSRIIALPFTRGMAQPVRLVDEAAQPTGARLMVHRPIRGDSGMNFTFSWQREDQTYMTRPAEAWLEIVPRRSETSDEAPTTKYIFYDPNFQPQQPSPVVSWTAESWPATARAAEIRMWCKMQSTAPTTLVPIAPIANQPPPSGSGFEVDGFEGMTLQVRTMQVPDSQAGLRVMVIQRHRVPQDYDQLKLDLLPAAAMVKRQFDAENGVVLHTFHVQGSDVAELANYNLQLTSRAAIEDEAWQLEQPMIISVTEQSNLIELNSR